jgi:hypothetical protein
METTTPVEPVPEQQSTSVWEDFVDIFYAPSSVFARRRDGRFALALVILTVLMGILFYASQTVLAEAMRAEFARAVEGQQLTAEQMAGMERMAGIFGTIGFAVTFPIGVLLTGLVLWLVGKAFGSVAGFAAAAMVATYAQTPKVLQQLAAILQGLVMEPVSSIYHVTLSPARFMDPEQTSAVVMGLLGRLDVFVIWSTVLLAIGLAVVGRVPRSQAYLAAAVVWLLGAVPIAVGALF